MLNRRSIQKITAIIMMAVFAVSITPSIVFHNWLTDHTDTINKIGKTNGERIGKQSFNCHCDHIVAESPFTEPGTTALTWFSQPFSSAPDELQVHFTSSDHFLYSLRGPPAV